LLLATGGQFGYYAIFTFLPTYLSTVRHLSVVGSGPYLALVIVGGILGYWASGWLNDRWGRRLNFIFFSVCSGIIILIYTRFVMSNSLLIVLSFPLGFFASGILSGFGSYLAELFPTRARATAQGFLYNGGRAGAAFAPTIIGFIAPMVGNLGIAISIVGPVSYLVCVIAVLLLPETKGSVLKVDE
jgi:MFS family permease